MEEDRGWTEQEQKDIEKCFMHMKQAIFPYMMNNSKSVSLFCIIKILMDTFAILKMPKIDVKNILQEELEGYDDLCDEVKKLEKFIRERTK